MKISEIFEDVYGPKSIVKKVQSEYSNKELAEKTAEFIQKNCQPWLFESQGGIVYRGIKYKSETMPVFVRKIRTNRRPKDSSKIVNNTFNVLIDIAGGEATRNNSMFVSGSNAMARIYGHPYVVFPIGDFHYTWSPVFKDWFQDLMTGDWNESPKKSLKRLMKPEFSTKKYSNWGNIMTDPDSYDFSKVRQAITPNQNLPEAIESNKEIMINADKALYINPKLYKVVAKYM